MDLTSSKDAHIRQGIEEVAFPYGQLRCTLEKYPRVLWVNQAMLDLLSTTEDSSEWREFIRENLFFLIPFEDRASFQQDLRRAAEQEEPIQVEHQVRTERGGTRCLVGWLRSAVGPEGEREYQFSYMPEPASRTDARLSRERAYQQALENTYDLLFRVDRRRQLLECLHMKPGLHLAVMPGVQMVLDREMTQVCAHIRPQDQENAKRFLHKILDESAPQPEDCCLEFCLQTADRKQKVLSVIRSDLDARYVLLCCREITKELYAHQVVEELEAVRSINRQIDQAGGDQPIRIGVYRAEGDRVRLRSGGRHPGLIREMSLKDFLERCKISREEYDQAVASGTSRLAGTDQVLGKSRQLYVVRTASPIGEEPGVLLFLYTFEEWKPEEEAERPRVTIRTFGFFDVLVDGKPILFHSEKSREMLAVLVDRKGSFVANPYFISCLWEDEPYSEKVQNRCRQTAYRLMETLKQYGVEDIVEKIDGKRRIVPERVDCDYYRYLRGEQLAGHPFNGAYMSDYSWGEETLSALLKSENMRVDWPDL